MERITVFVLRIMNSTAMRARISTLTLIVITTTSVAFPYTRPGSILYGDPMYGLSSARSVGMGGTGIAGGCGPSILALNPAGLSRLKSSFCLLELSGCITYFNESYAHPEYNKFSEKIYEIYQANDRTYFGFESAGIVAKIGELWFGYLWSPAYDFRYESKRKVMNLDYTLNHIEDIQRSGIVYSNIIGCSVGAGKGIMLGASYEILYGRVESKCKKSYPDGNVSDFGGSIAPKLDGRISGAGFNIGMDFDASTCWTFGCSFGMEKKLKENQFMYPGHFGAGIEYLSPGARGHSFSFDVITRRWEDSNAALKDTTEFRAGIEYFTDCGSPLWFGFRYEPWYGADKNIDMVFISAGMEFPFGMFKLGIASEFGYRSYYQRTLMESWETANPDELDSVEELLARFVLTVSTEGLLSKVPGR